MYVATDAHFDPTSPWRINRRLAFDKRKRQFGRRLLHASETYRGVSALLAEITLNV